MANHERNNKSSANNETNLSELKKNTNPIDNILARSFGNVAIRRITQEEKEQAQQVLKDKIANSTSSASSDKIKPPSPNPNLTPNSLHKSKPNLKSNSPISSNSNKITDHYKNHQSSSKNSSSYSLKPQKYNNIFQKSHYNQHRESKMLPQILPQEFYDFTDEFRESLSPIFEEDFKDVLPLKKIENDIVYVDQKLDKINQHKNPNYESVGEKFENMLFEGLHNSYWLGNVPENVNNPNNFSIDVQRASKTDDLSNRIDLFATLNFKDQQNQKLSVILGLDATTNNDPDKILDKLTRSYNNPKHQSLFGFSQIDYYKVNNQNIGSVTCIPRYCIALSTEDIGKLEKTSHPNSLTEFDQNDKFTILARFKVLAQIQAQNELKKLMLPQDKVRTTLHAKKYLDKIDACLEPALLTATKMIVKRRSLFFHKELQEQLENNESSGETKKNKTLILDKILESTQIYNRKDPFLVNMNFTQYLIKLAKDDNLPSSLSSRRSLSCQNYPSTMHELKIHYQILSPAKKISLNIPGSMKKLFFD